jgi:GNAT superfamily N-acetyltransferase
VRISQAETDDVAELARLLWLDTHDEELAQRSVDAFAAELAQWWAARRDSHVAFVARLRGPEIVGMAWVALVPRVPRPGATNRLSADIQSVFVLPEQRGQGIGSALVAAASEHATYLGSLRVTVHSGRRAVPVYERLGFESSRQLLQRTAPADFTSELTPR